MVDNIPDSNEIGAGKNPGILQDPVVDPLNLVKDDRPWTVKLMERVQKFVLSDEAKLTILKKMADGEWHDLTSLWRVAKKNRPIGLVGVGMILKKLEESAGVPLFEMGGSDIHDLGQVESSWKIRDEFIGILRAGVGTVPSKGGETLNRLHLVQRHRLQQNMGRGVHVDGKNPNGTSDE
ncbi:hypothetical protein GF325_12950 [Candidatus Bathyarchaeota archaeon]|nr:hypothetical protein [Candidatus Bathyarchaeota archaeon]